MRKLFLILCILPFYCFSQQMEMDSLTNSYVVQAVLHFDNSTKEELFEKTKQFIALKYNDSKSVVQNSDPEAGNFICKGNFLINNMRPLQNARALHTLIIDVKDGKVRFRLTKFILTCTNCYEEYSMDYPFSGFYKTYVNKQIEKAKVSTEEKAKLFIENYKEFMLTSVLKKDDW